MTDVKEVRKLLKEIDKGNSELSSLNKEFNSLCNQEDKLRKSRMAVWNTLKQKRWEMLKGIDINEEIYIKYYPLVDYVDGLYDKLKSWFRTKYGFENGVTDFGNISIRLFKNKPLNTQLGALNWEPFVECFSISEPSCSQFGVYILAKPSFLKKNLGKIKYELTDLKKDTEWVLTKTTYGSTRAISQFTTLQNALDYIYLSDLSYSE